MNDEQNNFTPAQAAAFKQIEDIMREHFDAAVLVVSCTHETQDKSDVIEATFSGGYAAAIGLSDLAKDMIKQTRQSQT